MARIIPSDYVELAQHSQHQLEFETLHWLAASLPDELTIFHHIEWTDSEAARSHFGEIDFAVLAPNGRLLVVEQKNGAVEVVDGCLLKTYRSERKDVGLQVSRTLDHIRSIWQQQHPGSYLLVEYLIYMPDYQISDFSAVQIPASNIVDANNKKFLPDIISSKLACKPMPTYDADEVARFLCGEFSVALDVGAAMEGAGNWYRRMAGETFDFLQRLALQPPHIKIVGCAGSGKTQLAQQLFAQAISVGKRPLYTCFNRPLSDAMLTILPSGGIIANVDQLTHLVMADRAVYDFDVLSYTLPRLRELALLNVAPSEWQFDVVIVDEGQDFSEEQYHFLRHLMKSNAAFYWLADGRQQLYDKPIFEPTLNASLSLNINYRSPREIVRYANLLLGLHPQEIPGSTWQGEAPVIEVMEAAQTLEKLQQLVLDLVQKGFALNEIVLLSYAGLERQSLREFLKLGDWRLRQFTGAYDDNSEPIWQDGELLVETVYRFKGRQAKAIIFFDIDFDAWSTRVQNRLYCGMTRSTRHLTMLLSSQAERILRERLTKKQTNE